MFNTFNLFNFFQQPNTGKTPIPGSYDISSVLDTVNTTSGKIADFNWKFVYIDRQIPKVIYLSSSSDSTPGGSTYEIPLYSEFSKAFINDPYDGIRAPLFFNSVSGKFLKDINSASFNIGITGKIFPHNRELSISKINLSGIIKESPTETNSITNNISGSIFNFNYNFYSLKENLSGSFLNANTHFNFSKIYISGSSKGFDSQKNIYNLKISGSFFPIKKDLADIKYYITGYQVGINMPKYEVEKADELTNLNYYIYDYSVGP